MTKPFLIPECIQDDILIIEKHIKSLNARLATHEIDTVRSIVLYHIQLVIRDLKLIKECEECYLSKKLEKILRRLRIELHTYENFLLELSIS